MMNLGGDGLQVGTDRTVFEREPMAEIARAIDADGAGGMTRFGPIRVPR